MALPLIHRFDLAAATQALAASVGAIFPIATAAGFGGALNSAVAGLYRASCPDDWMARSRTCH